MYPVIIAMFFQMDPSGVELASYGSYMLGSIEKNKPPVAAPFVIFLRVVF